MCSTPQKQPAATVAVCAPAGTFIGCAGAEDMLDEVKGRKKRVKKDIEVYERTTRKAVIKNRILNAVESL